MQDKDFLSYFDNLGRSPNEAAIKENTEKILATLLTVEHQAANKADEYNSQLGQLVSEDLEYTVSRLLQGISSDVLQNKKGFGTPLLSVLKSFKHIQPEKYISYTDKVTDRSKALTKGERSHYLASRLLSLYCLVSSGRIDNLPNSLDIYTNLYNSCIQNMREGPWCGQLVLRLIEASIETAADKKIALKRLNLLLKIFKSQLKSVATEFQLDNFGLLLYLSRKQYEIGGDKQGSLHDIITTIVTTPKILTKMFQALIESYPEKHICLRYLAEYLIRVRSVKEQNAFWQLVSSLLKEKDTIAKDKPWYQFYFHILTLFKYWVKDPQLTGQSFIKIMNSDVFLTWVKQLKVLNKFLRRVSQKIEEHLSKRIGDLLKDSGELTPLEFLFKIKETKEYLFDAKNPMAKALLGSLTEEETLTYVNKLIEDFKHERESYQFYMSELQVVFELNSQQISDKSILKICQFLIETYLTFEFQGEAVGNVEEGITPEDAKKAITDGVREEAFVKLNSIIARLLKTPSKAFEGRKNVMWIGISSNGELWTFRILKLLLKVGKDCELAYLDTLKATIKCLEGLQSEVKSELSDIQESKESKDNEGQEKTKKLIALILMISATALQLINHPDLEETVEELIECAKRIKEKLDAQEQGDVVQKKRKLDKKKQKKVESEEDKPVDVLIDVMVSLLTRCPGYLREAIERTFGQFVDDIDDFSLGNLIGVVTRKDEEYFDDMGDDDPQAQAGIEALKKLEEEEGDEDAE